MIVKVMMNLTRPLQINEILESKFVNFDPENGNGAIN